MAFVSDTRAIYEAQEGLRAARQRIAENSSRLAWHSAKFTVSGAGYTAVQQPTMFDCIFIEPPVLSVGVEVLSFPGEATLRYPLTTVGVWKWVTTPTPVAQSRKRAAESAAAEAAARNDMTAKLHALADAKAALNAATAPVGDMLYTGAYPWFHVDIPSVIREAEYGNISKSKIVFHLLWQGVAYKDIAASVMTALHADPSAAPLTPPSGS